MPTTFLLLPFTPFPQIAPWVWTHSFFFNQTEMWQINNAQNIQVTLAGFFPLFSYGESDSALLSGTTAIGVAHRLDYPPAHCTQSSNCSNFDLVHWFKRDFSELPAVCDAAGGDLGVAHTSWTFVFHFVLSEQWFMHPNYFWWLERQVQELSFETNLSTQWTNSYTSTLEGHNWPCCCLAMVSGSESPLGLLSVSYLAVSDEQTFYKLEGCVTLYFWIVFCTHTRGGGGLYKISTK